MQDKPLTRFDFPVLVFWGEHLVVWDRGHVPTREDIIAVNRLRERVSNDNRRPYAQ